jgi:hypothetical protein
MKSLFLAICMMVAILSQSSQAAEPKANPNVVRAFEIAFQDAENAQWSIVDNLFKVSFKMDNREMFAFFNSSGELLAVAKYLRVAQLPKAAQKKLNETAQGYTITELFEINDGAESKYYATLDKGSEQKVVESAGSSWSTFKINSK